MTITGQMNLEYPFQHKPCPLWREPIVGIETCGQYDNGQVLMLVLFTLAGALIWHFADKTKKRL